MAPEAATGDGNGSSAMEATRNKPRKRKKSRSSMEATQNKHRKPKKSRPSSLAAQSTTSLSTGGDGDGDRRHQQLAGDGLQLQQQRRGKTRVVWTDELHNLFLKAYNVQGEDAVPKKILAMMNVDGITRENVASHLQKHRLSLKRQEQRRDKRPSLHEEASSQTPLTSLRPPTQESPLSSLHPPAQEPPLTSLHPPAQEPPASSSPHPFPPQAPITDLNMSQLHIGHDQQLLQTPLNCFNFNSNNAATNLLLHPLPDSPMVQLTHDGAIAVQLKLVEKQEAGRDARVQQAAAGASGYNPMQVCQAVSMTAVPEVNMMRYQEAEIHMAQLQMAAKAEEGQDQVAEPGAAAAGSLMSPPGGSIHGQYWKSDNVEGSWDYFGLPPYKPD